MYLCIHSFINRFIYLFIYFSFYLYISYLPFLHARLILIFLTVGEIYLESLCYYNSACSVHVLLILFDFVHNLI